MAGVTPTGFVAKTIEEIKQEIEDEELLVIDPALNLSASQPLGQLNAVFSKKLAELWEALGIAYNAFDRDASEGRLLDNIGSITGTPRDPARKSTVTATLNLNAGFSRSAGTMFASVVGQPTILFTNRDVVSSVGAGTYPAVFESVAYGPVVANAGTLTVINPPISGWNSITNALDATLGSIEETDAQYRQRQDDEQTAAGASTIDAIRADVLKVSGVEQCLVFENTSLVTDGTGLPGKAIEVVIYDGALAAAADNDVAQAIWDTKPAGGETYGSVTGTALDSQDDPRLVKFSRATVRQVWLEFDVTVTAQDFPVDGVNLIKAAATARGNLLTLDEDAIALVLRASALSVPGVRDVSALRLGFAASPVGTSNLTITGREIAKFDTSRVVVNLV